MDIFGVKIGNPFKSKAKAVEVINNSSVKNNQLQRVLYQMLANYQATYYDSGVDTYIDKGYTFNPHCYTVINFIARNISQVPFYLYKITDKKAHGEYLRHKSLGNFPEANVFRWKSMEKVETGTLANFFKQPNPSQGWSEFIFEKIGFRKLTGNSYVYGLTPAGYKEDFFSQAFNAPSPVMEIVQGDWKEPVKGYKIIYSYGGEAETIDKIKILHQKHWNPETDNNGQSPYGLSPVKVLLRTLKRSNEAVDANLAMLENGGPPGIMSNEADRPMKPEEVDAAEDNWKKKRGGGKNRNKLMFAATKVSFQQVGLDAVDMQLLESEKVDLATFARAYGIDEIIFLADSSSYNNKIFGKKSVWEDTLIPELNLERDSWNRFLTPAWSLKDSVEYFIDYDVSGVPCLQADLEKLSLRVEREVKIGLWTPNEGRVMLGKEPVMDNPDMDKHYMLSELKTLGDVKDPILELLSSVSPLVANSLIAAIPPEMLAALFKKPSNDA